MIQHLKNKATQKTDRWGGVGAVAAAATEAGAAVEMQDKKIPRKTQESLLGNGSTFRKKGRNQKKKKTKAEEGRNIQKR